MAEPISLDEAVQILDHAVASLVVRSGRRLSVVRVVLPRGVPADEVLAGVRLALNGRGLDPELFVAGDDDVPRVVGGM